MMQGDMNVLSTSMRTGEKPFYDKAGMNIWVKIHNIVVFGDNFEKNVRKLQTPALSC